ncbi:MAG: hypothetical protein JWN76_2453 [Chitinophagaceae bacterium]|nr:hypothetical protein [Chitinophagaceae bacterium]
MKIVLSLILLCGLKFPAFAQKVDTLFVNPSNLVLNQLQNGNYCYLVFNKKSLNSPAERLTLVKMKIEKGIYENKPVYFINQKWEADTIVHSAFTILDAKTFATVQHNTWWKRLGYTMQFNFVSKKILFEGILSDSAKQKITGDFLASFSAYNLNWHSDLVVFSVLPYAANRTFIINYYDPGFGSSEKVEYTVTGTESIMDHSGLPVDCWILTYNLTQSPGYQKFWISKRTKEILKEEDFSRGSYRYKIKLSNPVVF